MKKLLLLVLLLIPSFVYAISYTEYEEYLMGIDDYYEESDLLKREEYKVYNTYELKRNYLDYQESCPLYDKDDYKKESMITSKKTSTNTEGNVSYYVNGKLNYITVINYNRADIYEIEITKNGEKIPFEIEPLNNRFLDIEHLTDGDRNTSTYTDQFAQFNIKFDNVEATGVDINFYTNKNLYLSKFRIFYTNDDNEQEDISLSLLAKYIHFHPKEEYTHIIDLVGTFTSSFPVSATYYYLDKLYYHCFEEMKEPTNIYVNEGDNLINDDYKIKYNYYKRNIIEDEIVVPEIDENPIENQIIPLDNPVVLFEESKQLLPNNTIMYLQEQDDSYKPIKKKKRNNKINTIIEDTPIPDIIPEVEPLKKEIISSNEKNNRYVYIIYIGIFLVIFILLYLIKRLSKNN